MANDAYQLQGQNGGKYLTAGGSWSADADNDGRAARWLSVVNDAVLSDMASNVTSIGSIATKVLLAGQGIGGAITQVSVTSGDVIVYY